MTRTRRTLNETLTPAQLAFLAPAGEAEQPKRNGTKDPSVVAMASAQGESHDSSTPPCPIENDRQPSAGRRPEPLRSVTLRLRASVAEALRRESIQRSLHYREPFSQQAIVEAAVCSWLKEHGCRLNDEVS